MRFFVLMTVYIYSTFESAKGAIGTGEYANETAGENVGVQLEYWW